MRTIKDIEQQYKWMAKKGIDLSSYNVDHFIYEPTILQRSFKNNPTAVKNLHNYKFKFNRDIDSGILALYERIETLKFVKI